jgi:hypothetical protein
LLIDNMPGGAAATKRARTKAKARAKVRKAAALPSTYVVDLPDAVWHNIFAPFSEKTIRGADYITLRALVLVNKAFNALATPYLYATVDAPVFDTLLAYPKYAAMVKSVYPYQSKETWWQIANIIAEAVGKSVDELPSKWRPTPGESKEVSAPALLCASRKTQLDLTARRPVPVQEAGCPPSNFNGTRGVGTQRTG